MMSLQTCVALALVLAPALGFSPVSPPQHNGQLKTPQFTASPAISSPLFQKRTNRGIRSAPSDSNNHNSKRQKLKNLWNQVQRRFDTLEAAGLPDAKTAGLFGTVKKLHDPKTYLALLLLSGFRYDWCFRSIYYWFVVGFCIKWYRARYVFKIPVWDRQPNWNNVITSKEQEKDLKAFTCKNCGSTIFIAKTREFFFEGTTGIGGLGCFSCGAKGKDNFVMDRDRILEDVGDEDDYFDYERPLDFVSRAERRKIMKEAKGDEDLANQMLIDKQTGGTTGDTPKEEPAEMENTQKEEPEVVDVEVEASSEDVVEEEANPVEAPAVEEEEKEPEVEAAVEEEPEVSETVEPVAEEPVKEAPAPKKPAKKAPETSAVSDDDLDILGLD